MNEINLTSSGKTYRVTNQNNGHKYDRAITTAGVGATEEQVLAHYDKLGGYIQDENGNKVDNGNFWQIESERLQKDLNNLKNKSDEQLMDIMRNSIDNSYVPSSIYNKAKLELEFRTLTQKTDTKSSKDDLIKKLIDIQHQINKLVELDKKGLLERKELYEFRDSAENEIRSFIDKTDDETQRHFKKITSGWKNVPKPGFTNPGEAEKLLAYIVDFIDESAKRLTGKNFRTEVYISAGRTFDGRKQLENVFDTAQKEIFIIDNYLQKSVLPILADVAERQQDFIFKFLIGNKNKSKFDGFIADLPDFSKQYPLVEIECRQNDDLHDRYIIIDEDFLYTVGSSLDSVGEKGNFVSMVRDEKSKTDHTADITSLWNKGLEVFKN